MTDDLYANKGPHVLGVIIAFPILAAVCLGLRLFTRYKIIRNVCPEDYLIVGALVFSIGTSVCMGYQVKNGMGMHIVVLTIQEGTNSLKYLFCSILTYNMSLTLMKLAMLLQYLRICISPGVRIACNITFIFVIATGIELFLMAIFTCDPVPYFWNKSIKNGHCVNEPALWFANAGVNIFQDVCLLVLPFFILKDLLLGTRQKIGLMIVLSLGAFACIASVCRLHALYIVSISKDITWDNPGAAIWSSLELNIAIICASLSVLRPLIASMIPGFTHRSSPKAHTSNHLSFSHNDPGGTAVSKNMGKFEMMNESGGEV